MLSMIAELRGLTASIARTAWPCFRFALPSALPIAATYVALRFLQRSSLAQPIGKDIDVPMLSSAGRLTGWGIALTAVVMLGASAPDVPRGWPTFAAGVAVFLAVCLQKRHVDLGPNLSVTGSLATILWLTALRREGIAVRALDFLKLGIAVMLPALMVVLVSLELGHLT